MNQILLILARKWLLPGWLGLTAVAAGQCLAQEAGTPVAVASPGSAVVPPVDAFFDGLGGKSGIQKMVEQFMQIVLADERIKAQFTEADVPRLKEKLAQQFCELSGGPCQYSGKPMNVIHDGLHITLAQFNALAEDLQLAMAQQAIPNRIQNKLVARLAPMQRVIVGK